MLPKPNHKWIFASLITISFFAFLFVNANECTRQSGTCTKTDTIKIEQIKEEEETTQKFALPDVVVIEKVIRLVQRFSGGRN